MTAAPDATVDLGPLGLDRGGHLLVQRALDTIAAGGRLAVRGTHPALRVHLGAWCRAEGHRADGSDVIRGTAGDDRWRLAERAGTVAAPVEHAVPTWGLAARGALVEEGGPPLRADLVDRATTWSDLAPKLYAQAAAAQWDPATAIAWDAPFELAPEIELAVVQVMTYLIENELAALSVPSQFIARIHPHFREVVQLLAVQVADEARHVEVFTRRAQLRSEVLGRSGAGGRASLQTLLDEPDLPLAIFLLSVLGEGSFLNLLAFLERHAPDPVTAQLMRLVLQDEARHVAFGVAHLEHATRADPALRSRLRAAVERRHDVLSSTAGLHAGVHDALVVLAAGSWEPHALERGWDAVVRLEGEMDEGRRRRLARLGFDTGAAEALSALHTRNFM